MTFAFFSDLLFAVGRRRPGAPLAALRMMPLPLLHALRRPGLRVTMRRAARAPYYREALGATLARAAGPEDLGSFFLTPGVLKREPERLLCGTPDLAIESSGTSGHVTKVYLSRAELEYAARQGNLLLTANGVGAGDRLLCTLDLAWGLGSLLVERGVRYTPVFAMVVGRVDPLEGYRRLAGYGFNVLVSDPFWLARLTEIARDHGRPQPMKLLVGGGEGITPHLRAELERFWGARVCMTYASTEAATVLGFECAERNGYHVNEFDFHVEIVDADPAGYGEVVVTTVNRRVMPLLRYRTGDVTCWMPGRCPCGLRFRRLAPLRGRVDEQVSCAWGNLHPEFFGPLVGALAGLGDWQVALYERGLSPVVQFRIETAGEVTQDAIVEQILAALRRLYPDAWATYCQRLIDVEFSFFPPGTLRRHRKLLRLVDERGAASPEWARQPVVVGTRP